MNVIDVTCDPDRVTLTIQTQHKAAALPAHLGYFAKSTFDTAALVLGVVLRKKMKFMSIQVKRGWQSDLICAKI